jgi:hypothetical protein
MAVDPRLTRCLFFASVIGMCAGCGFYDPTELNFYVNVLNDTSRPVVVVDCGTRDGLCHGKGFSPVEVKPGETEPDVQTSVGGLNVELIKTPTGKRLGCVPLYYNYNASGATVRVSSLVRCRSTYPIVRKHS